MEVMEQQISTPDSVVQLSRMLIVAETVSLGQRPIDGNRRHVVLERVGPVLEIPVSPLFQYKVSYRYVPKRAPQSRKDALFRVRFYQANGIELGSSQSDLAISARIGAFVYMSQAAEGGEFAFTPPAKTTLATLEPRLWDGTDVALENALQLFCAFRRDAAETLRALSFEP